MAQLERNRHGKRFTTKVIGDGPISMGHAYGKCKSDLHNFNITIHTGGRRT